MLPSREDLQMAAPECASESPALTDPDSPRHDCTATPINPTSSQNDSRSRLATQPVLVRSYSGNPKPTVSPISTSWFLSLFRSRTRQQEIPLPSEKDFSIESILQAIDPEIQETLTSIAKICSRSKLSLANEYGSHIAPWGEITAPPGLEAFDDRVEVMEDEITDAEHHMNPLSFQQYLDSLQHTDNESHPGRIPPSPGMDSNAETVLAIGPEPASPPPFVRQFTSNSHNTGSQLLAKHAGATRKSTMAGVSEVHLDANADGCNFDLLPQAALDRRDPIPYYTGAEPIQNLLGWLRSIGYSSGPDASPVLQSAEERLRAMLGADGQESTRSAAS